MVVSGAWYMHQRVGFGLAAVIPKIRMAAFVDFTVEAIGAIFRGRQAQAHLVVDLVAIDPFPVNGISPVNGQEEVLAADRGCRLLQFRGEFFNIFNHTNFANIGPTLGSATYGTVIAARDPRIIQLGLKLYF